MSPLSLEIICQHILSSPTQVRCGMFLTLNIFPMSARLQNISCFTLLPLLLLVSQVFVCEDIFNKPPNRCHRISPSEWLDLLPGLREGPSWPTSDSPCQMMIPDRMLRLLEQKPECLWWSARETRSLSVLSQVAISFYMFLPRSYFLQSGTLPAMPLLDTHLMDQRPSLELYLSWLIPASSLTSPLKFLSPDFCLPRAQSIHLGCPPSFFPTFYMSILLLLFQNVPCVLLSQCDSNKSPPI